MQDRRQIVHRRFHSGRRTLRGGVIAIVLAATGPAIAADIFVAPGGDDATGNGSIGRPYRTLQKAANVAAGTGGADVVHIREGTYRETVTVPAGGDNTTFRAYNDEQVIVTGLEVVTDWSPSSHNGNIFSAPFSLSGPNLDYTDVFYTDNAQQLDRVNVRRATWPDRPAEPQLLDLDHFGVQVEPSFDKKIRFVGGLPAGNWNGAVFHGLIGKAYTSSQGVVAFRSGDTLTMSTVTAQWEGYNEGFWGLAHHGYGYLTNHLNCLDAPNEYHWENNTLYLWKPGGGDPRAAGITVEARKRRWGFILDGRSNVRLEKIQFFAAGVRMRSTNSSVVTGGRFRYGTTFFVTAGGSEYQSRWTIDANGNDNVIKNCYVHAGWGSGVTIDGQRNVVRECVIEEVNWAATYGNAIDINGNHEVVEHNTLRRAGRTFIKPAGKASVIRYNHLHDGMLISRDGGGMYVSNHSGRTGGVNTVISHNWVHDLAENPFFVGHATSPALYFDQGADNFTLHHNVLWNVDIGIYINGGNDNTGNTGYLVANNSVFNTSRRNIARGGNGPSGQAWSVTSYNNLGDDPDFLNVPASDANSVSLLDDTGFFDAGWGDFRLRVDSPARNAGRAVSGITLGVRDGMPDAGAYEFNADVDAAHWVAGALVAGPGGSVNYEAEAASLTRCLVESNNAGASQMRFANFNAPSGASVRFTGVAGERAGLHVIRFRYALGAAAARTLRLTVNGSATNVTFTPTGAWDEWGRLSVPVYLLAGARNTIKLTTTGTEGPNLDLLNVQIARDHSGSYHIQAENFVNDASMFSPMITQSHVSASGPSALYILASGRNANDSMPTSGYAEYRFRVPVASPTAIWFKARAGAEPFGGNDSFWLDVLEDTTGPIAWNGAIDSEQWKWYRVYQRHLPSGLYTLRVAYREDGTHLDRIFIATDGSQP